MLRRAKENGFSDIQLASPLGRQGRALWPQCGRELGIKPVYKLVDTCAAEFEAYTPYYLFHL